MAPHSEMSSSNPHKPTGGAVVSSTASADLQDNLRRLDRLANLGLLAASAAHEIKNGLVAINTFVEMLLEKGEDPEMAGVVRSELKRIDSLVTQMLRFAAPKPAAHASVNIHHLLDHSLRLLEHQMTGRMITIKRDYRALLGTVRGDESQLHQALMNLLLNAVEAMSNNGGELTVVTENSTGNAGHHRLKIHIRDTGAGIAEENLARVFEAFFTTKKNGTGLGLAICQRVAHEHHGELEVRSETGRGSTFIISLPVE
jgi:signal transduction histidine kinase